MNNQTGVTEKNSSPTLGRFAAKVAIVAAIFGITIVVIGNVLLGAVRDVVTDVTATLQQSGGSQFWAKMEHNLDRAADPKYGLPPG